MDKVRTVLARVATIAHANRHAVSPLVPLYIVYYESHTHRHYDCSIPSLALTAEFRSIDYSDRTLIFAPSAR